MANLCNLSLDYALKWDHCIGSKLDFGSSWLRKVLTYVHGPRVSIVPHIILCCGCEMLWLVGVYDCLEESFISW